MPPVRRIKIKGGRGGDRNPVQARARRVVSKKSITKLVKGVIKNQSETKMVVFFEGPVANPSPLRNSTGLFGDAAPVSQNQFITDNTTDILKLLPDVAQGTADNTREGREIQPTSCMVRCKVMISPTTTGAAGWANGFAYDVTMVAYMLQHVSYKTYSSLHNSNDFGQLLSLGQGSTINFNGSFSAANLPVEKGYYRLLAKRTHRLRSSGIPKGALPVVSPPTNYNAHTQCYEWTWNLGKHLPKKLVYPEDNVSVANGANEPLNAAPFWCVGYYNTDGTVASTGVIDIQQEYTSILKFKDF